MTGEITLRGRVLPIGGLKEKSLAAFRAGIKIIVIPERNEKDLDEVPKSLRRKLRWIVVKNMSDVLKIALLAGHIGARRAAHTVASKMRRPRKTKGRLWKRSEKLPRKSQRERSIPLRP